WCVVPRGVTRLQDGEYLSGLLGRAHPEEAVVFVLQPGHHATVEDREGMVGQLRNDRGVPQADVLSASEAVEGAPQLPTQGVRRRVRWTRFIRFPVASSACTIFSQGLNHSRPRSSPESRSRTGGPRSPCRHACASPEARRCRGNGGRGRGNPLHRRSGSSHSLSETCEQGTRKDDGIAVSVSIKTQVRDGG